MKKENKFLNKIWKILAWGVSGFCGGFVLALQHAPIEQVDWSIAISIALAAGSVKVLTGIIEYIEDWAANKKHTISAYFP